MWGGGADRELVLLHAILSFGLPQQTAVSRHERNMNADSDSVGFLKTTSHLMPLRRPQRLSAQAEREEQKHSTCLTKVIKYFSQLELTALSDRSIILLLMLPVFSGGGHCHHQGTEGYSVLWVLSRPQKLQGPRTWTAGVRVTPAHHVLPTWWGLLSESRRFDSS